MGYKIKDIDRICMEVSSIHICIRRSLDEKVHRKKNINDDSHAFCN